MMNYNSIKSTVFAILLLLLVSACSSAAPSDNDDESSSGGATVNNTTATPNDNDTIAPTVSSHTPSAGANNVAVGTSIIVTFSEAMNATSIENSGSFTLKDGNNSTVGASVEYVPSGYQAKLKPTSDLQRETQYTATLSSSITDLAGNSLNGTPYSWSFTTPPGGTDNGTTPGDTDKTAPTVKSTTPSANATNVAVGTSIIVTFSEAMNGTSIENNGSFTLKDANNSTVGASVEYVPNGYQAKLKPTSDLQRETQYTATLSSSITDSAGNSLNGTPYSWSFTTPPGGTDNGTTPRDTDKTAPTVKSTTPSANATNVAVGTSIIVTFSEAMNGTSIENNGSFTLKDANKNTVSGSVSYDSTNKQARFTPSISLQGETTYSVTLSSSITDQASNALSATTWSFTTEDKTAPTVSQRSPSVNATKVARNTQISVVFSEAMNATTITKNGSLTVKDSENNTVSGRVNYTNTQTVTFSPTTSLQGETTYTITLSTDITDSAGNALPKTTWSFTTADATNPVVKSTIPSNQANGIDLDTKITVTFSEAMNATTITKNGSFSVKDSENNTVSGRVNYDATNQTATFDPSSNWQTTTSYTVTLSTDIRDTSGNSLDSLYSSNFTTLGVVINEIAWMGTTTSANDEWIELYNPSSSAIDLTNWILQAKDGAPKITLSGAISAGGYFLLERTDDNSVENIGADMIYSGTLSNSGENLSLVTSHNRVVDRVNGWFAGTSSTRKTMERKSSSEPGTKAMNWSASTSSYKGGFGTPKAKNSNFLNGTIEQLNTVSEALGAINVYFK